MLALNERLDAGLSTLSQRWRALEEVRPALMLTLATACLFVVYLALDKIVLDQLTPLPESAYYQGSVLLALLLHVPFQPLLAVAGALTAVFLWLRWRAVFVTWEAAGFPVAVRAWAVVIAAILGWVCATYDYNLFYDRYHHVDRVLLVLAVPAIAWRPVMIAPWVCLVTAFAGQYMHPVEGYSWAEFSMLIGLLLVVLATLIVRACIQRDWTVECLLLAVAVIASHYWIPGIGKFALEWHSLDEIHRLMANTYGNGWLGFLTPDEMSRIARQMAAFDPALRTGTLVLEWAVLFVLWRRGSLIAFLLCWIGFHFSIFATSGIFFWKWILVESALLIVLVFFPPARIERLFTPPVFALSILLIASSGFWSGATRLAWLDMPMSYVYRFTATTSDGAQHVLPPAYFAPYDYQFTLGRFGFLSDQPTLPIVWGASSRPDLLRKLNQATTAEAVLEIERLGGEVQYDERRIAAFDRFLRQFVGTWVRAGGKPGLYRPIRAPRQLWTFPLEASLPAGSRITTVRVDQVVTWFDGEHYAEIARRPVREVDIVGAEDKLSGSGLPDRAGTGTAWTGGEGGR